MKKRSLKVFFIIVLVIVTSCDEDFNPKISIPEYYSFNCIIRCDSSYQIATLSKIYDVAGYDPLTNTTDPFVKGAKITLVDSSIYNNQKFSYQFRDTLIDRSDNSRYTTPLNCYYFNNFQFTQPTWLKIEVVLPNGRRIKAANWIVPIDKYSIDNFKGTNPQLIGKGKLLFDWKDVKYSENYGQPFCYPELIIKYSYYESGKWNKYQKKIPLLYSWSDGQEIPIYPRIQISPKDATYDTLTIRKTLEKISTNDSNRDKYRIEKVVFMLHLMDYTLAQYLSFQQSYTDDFSVSVTQPDFGNLTGARGIFACMQTLQIEIPFTPMIKSLGYKTD